MIRQRPQQWKELIPEKRRSEVDRRLDFLVNPKGSGALKDVHQTTVLRLLRLFNLCDLGTNSADKNKAKQAFGHSRRAGRPRHVQNAVDQCQVCVVNLWAVNPLLCCKSQLRKGAESVCAICMRDVPNTGYLFCGSA